MNLSVDKSPTHAPLAEEQRQRKAKDVVGQRGQGHNEILLDNNLYLIGIFGSASNIEWATTSQHFVQ